MTLVKVASISELDDHKAKMVKANGHEIALIKIGDDFYAVENKCPHRGGPLSEGTVEDSCIVCPWHGWRFDVKTGTNEFIPTSKISIYKVTVKGSDVLVEV